MRLYVELAKRSFQQTLTYRGATLAGIFTNSVFGVMIASMYLALYASSDPGRPPPGGFDRDQLMTWVWLNQSLLMPVYIWGWWEVARAIQTGSIATDLMKPIDYFSMWMARDLGRGAAHTLVRGLPTFFIGWLIFHIQMPNSVGVVAATLCSIVLAICTSFCLRFLVNVLGFWVIDFRGLSMMYVAVINLLSGMLIPLALYPAPLRIITEWLPFRAVLMLPAEIYLQQRSFLQGISLQLLWIAVLVIAAKALMRKGERKLVVHGG